MGEKNQKASLSGHNITIYIYKYKYIFKKTCPESNNMRFQIQRPCEYTAQ